MVQPDPTLLFALEALLEEGSVVGAAKRLQLSPSAMSRTLTRLRHATGDPLLVRAGRGLTPTPHALVLKERVGAVATDVRQMLQPPGAPDLKKLRQTFTIRSRDGFVETFGPVLVERMERDAPEARLRFVLKTDKDSTSLRDGSVDLETGVLGPEIGAEIRARTLFRDRFVGVARSGHPLMNEGVSTTAYAAARHVGIARDGAARGRLEEAMEAVGLQRKVATTVGGFSAALALARSTDLIATTPERHTEALRRGMHTFELPFMIEPITISLLWHPRLDADPAHQWLRQCVIETCAGN